MERMIDSQIFFGGPGYFKDLGKFYHCVDRVLSLISGLQQPPHSPDEETARANKVMEEIEWKNVEGYVQNIVCALLGPEYIVCKVQTDMLEEIKKLKEALQTISASTSEGWIHEVIRRTKNNEEDFSCDEVPDIETSSAWERGEM